jgi:uncharacterized lipoprotein YmbA
MNRTGLTSPLVLGATVLLAACASSSPPPGWHSLVPSAGAASAPAPTRQSLVVGLVSVPDEVDRPQLVLRNAAGVPTLLDGERWSEPLKAQLPRALALSLAPRLPGTLVSTSAGGAVALPNWRLAVEVQRFELQRGPDRAVLRAVWSLKRVDPQAAAPSVAPQLFETTVPAAGSNAAALAAAMTTAVDQFAGQISRSVCAAGPC